jgi:threonyl-tRNA synthetase
MDDHDHRAIANRLDLFHQQEEAPGMVFWHPRGFALYRVIEDHIRARMAGAGFREIRTPQLIDRALWEASGHWDNFRDEMFVVRDGERAHALKPVSCPCHVQVFKQRVRSFRDLPLRYCEFGSCHRNEASGALQGLARTRAFVQDDAHILCAPEQVEAEVRRFSVLLRRIYAELGFADVSVTLATRPAQRAGDDALWDQAEAALGAAAHAAELEYSAEPGGGAFYGPKLSFYLSDRVGRSWQCGTIQLDFVLPERLGARYVDSSGAFKHPVMLHQAVLGSLERFIALLLEHYDGQLPLWLAPDQAVVASIGEERADYARSVAEALSAYGLRVALDLRAERLGRKIVDAREAGIPIMLAVGAREAEAGTVALRRRDGAQEVMAIEEAAARLRVEAVPVEAP